MESMIIITICGVIAGLLPALFFKNKFNQASADDVSEKHLSDSEFKQFVHNYFSDTTRTNDYSPQENREIELIEKALEIARDNRKKADVREKDRSDSEFKQFMDNYFSNATRTNDYFSQENAEIELIKKALEIARGNRKKAAMLLNVSIRLLGYKLEKHKIADDV